MATRNLTSEVVSTPFQYVVFTESVSTPLETWERAQQSLSVGAKHPYEHGVAFISRSYAHASEKTGSAVIITPHYKCLPVLIGDDGQPIPLYELVEEWDAITDYDEIQERFPTLSYMQIAGAIAFLRKIAQFNANNLDIDALEDQDIESNPNFQEELRNAIADQVVCSPKNIP